MRHCSAATFALLVLAASAWSQTPAPFPPQRPGEVVRPAPRPAPEVPAASTGIVRGRVTTAAGRPLRLARVAMVEGASRRSIAEATDADGRYEFTEVPAGTYTVTARKAGFATLEFGQRHPADPGRRIRVADAAAVERIDFVLPAASAMSGRVIDENGDPVEGAAVSVYTMTIVQGRRRLIASGAERRTDDLGRFRLFNVDPGEYVIAAAAATTGAQRLPGYAPVYFPGATSLSDAEVVTVKSGEDVTSLDLRVTPGRAAKVSGVVLDSMGQPLDGALLLDASRRSGVLAGPAVRGRPQGDGRFEFLNIPPGDYVLQASGRSRDGIEFGTRFLVIGEDDVTGLTLQTSTGSHVSGRVTLEGGRSRIQPRDFQFNFQSVNEDTSPNPGTYRAKINDDWSFEYDGLFGMLLMRPAGRAEWLVKAIRVNGMDVTDVPLSFGRRDDSLTDVEVVLTNQGAEVTGTAVDPRGQVGLPYTVIVFPVDRDLRTRHTRFIKAVRSEPDGTFTVRGLPTAEYFVAAVDRIQMTDGSGEWQEPAFLESLEPVAARVALEGGRPGSAAPHIHLRPR